jgi:hypothetical protein
MPKSHIDATALAGVVIASAVALLLPVSLAWLSSIAGLTLLFVLLSFDREGYRSAFQSLAFAAVFGICLALAAYEPLQVLASSGQPHAAADPRVTGEWLPVIWLCVTVIFWGIDRGRMSGREGVGAESTRPAVVGHRTFIPEPTAPPAREVHPEPAPVPPPTTVAPPPPTFAPAAASSTATMWGLSSSASPSPQLVRRQSEPPPAPTPAPAETASVAAPPAEAIPLPRSGKETMIYVTLLGEGLNVLRSVRAEHLGRDFYQIVDVMPEGETWEYRPGQIVRCKKKNLSSGKAWVAVEEAPRAS